MKKLLLITLLSTLAINNAWATDNTIGAGAGAAQQQETLNRQLSIAVVEGKLEKTKNLLEQKADVNALAGKAKRTTPLMMAASRLNNLDIVNLLIKNGARVNDQDAQGDTALVYAIAVRDDPQVKALLAAGADPYSKNKKGYDAFAHAREQIAKGYDAIDKILKNYANKGEGKDAGK